MLVDEVIVATNSYPVLTTKSYTLSQVPTMIQDEIEDIDTSRYTVDHLARREFSRLLLIVTGIACHCNKDSVSLEG